MLNDVHAPPLEEESGRRPTRRSLKAKHPPRDDRVHSLEKTADHGMGTNLIFTDPEDRGASFNTTMSAVIVSGVLLSLLVVAWLIWK